ncbi:MAG: hypothetical protein R3E32_18340 [Chitinophagales bacterium]
MTKIPSIYHHNKPSKWGLISALFLSVFVFSGHVFHISLQQQTVTQTEWILSQKRMVAPSIISYKKAFEQTPLSRYFNNFKEYIANVLVVNDTLYKLHINNTFKQVCLYISTPYFLPVKTIPQGSDKALSYYLLGSIVRAEITTI